MDNARIAKQLVRIAKMLVAADGKTAADFIKDYEYTDANPDFPVKDVKRGDGKVSFTVFLTKSIKLDVEIELSGDEELSGSVTTAWNIDQYVYKSGGFQPETTPKTTNVNGTYSVVEKAVTDAIASCTKGLKIAK